MLDDEFCSDDEYFDELVSEDDEDMTLCDCCGVEFHNDDGFGGLPNGEYEGCVLCLACHEMECISNA